MWIDVNLTYEFWMESEDGEDDGQQHKCVRVVPLS
jgi:hypothetical protein